MTKRGRGRPKITFEDKVAMLPKSQRLPEAEREAVRSWLRRRFTTLPKLGTVVREMNKGLFADSDFEVSDDSLKLYSLTPHAIAPSALILKVLSGEHKGRVGRYAGKASDTSLNVWLQDTEDRVLRSKASTDVIAVSMEQVRVLWHPLNWRRRPSRDVGLKKEDLQRRSFSELFCGKSFLSSKMKRLGWNVKRNHSDPDVFSGKRFKPFRLVRGSDLRAAFETLSDEELRSLFRSIWSHASPCCSTFSTMSTSKHGRAQWNEYCGVTEEAWHANRILWILADVLVQRHKAFGSRAKFTLENPQTQAFALHPAVQFLCKETEAEGVSIRMCTFFAKYEKPTWIFSNCPAFRTALESLEKQNKCKYCKQGIEHPESIRDLPESKVSQCFPIVFADKYGEIVANALSCIPPGS